MRISALLILMGCLCVYLDGTAAFPAFPQAPRPLYSNSGQMSMMPPPPPPLPMGPMQPFDAPYNSMNQLSQPQYMEQPQQQSPKVPAAFRHPVAAAYFDFLKANMMKKSKSNETKSTPETQKLNLVAPGQDQEKNQGEIKEILPSALPSTSQPKVETAAQPLMVQETKLPEVQVAESTVAEDETSVLPMREKFGQWLSVMDDLKKAKATDEAYAEAFVQFTGAEVDPKILADNPYKPAAEPITPTEQSSSSLVSGVPSTETAQAVPAAFKRPTLNQIQTSEAESDDEDEYDDEDDEAMFAEEDEMNDDPYMMHQKTFMQAHQPVRPPIERASYMQPNQMQKKKMVNSPSPPELWMSSRTSNIKNGNKFHSNQGFEFASAGDDEEALESQRFHFGVNPDDLRVMFESMRTTHGRDEEDDEREQMNTMRRVSMPARMRNDDENDEREFIESKPMAAAAARHYKPVFEDQAKPLKLSMNTNQKQSKNRFQQRKLANKHNLYQTTRISRKH